MISIQQNLSELEKTHQMRQIALECYLAAIGNMAHYAVDLESAITGPHRQYLSNLAAELAAASPEALSESRSTLRGLLRDYRDRAARYLGDLRNQLSFLLDGFESALSMQDKDVIERHRQALEMFLSAYDGSEPNADDETEM